MSRSELPARHSRLDLCLRALIEALLLGMVVAAPWALGGTTPEATIGLGVGLALVLALWAARIVVTGTLVFRGGPALHALAGLTLLSAAQLVPVPAGGLGLISPATLETNLRLRPDVRERLPGEEGPDVRRPDAFPVSLSPPDTRGFFTDLFAVTLLYAAARSNLAGPGPLRRLAWVLAANGALLCAVGIAQKVSSPPNVVYWSIPTDGTVFGPFVNRNHLPFYANVCLGLTCGLLAAQVRGGGFADVLQRPAALWLLVLAGVTAVGVAYSQSRGGVAAALAAAAGCLLVWFANSRRAGGLGWLPWAALAALAVGSWLGWGQVTARLETLEEGTVTQDHRVELWAAGLRLAARYPALGTGGGTYAWVEPATRTSPGTEGLSVENAHNEYVEALVEGGAVRLGLTLWLVVGPVVRVVRRHRRVTGEPGSEMLLGGLFGFLALALHSFTDFGVHMPAVAVLAAVHTACLMGAADSRRPTAARRMPLAGLVVAVGLVAAGALVAWDRWSADRAEQSRTAAGGLEGDRPLTAAQAERAVHLLAAASVARPENALYHHELGQAHLAVALTRPPGSAERTAAVREALREWRAARDLAPLMAPTHARLGHHRDLFERADPALVYFERARSLLPTDAGMIFYCGQARWQAGDVAGACADWRASLTNSDRYLKDVLDLAAPRLGPAEILRDVLPDRPAVLLQAANRLLPNAGPTDPARRPFLERARDALAAQPTKSAADWELEARLEVGLGRPKEAAAAYRRALGLAPRQTRWRLDYAQLLRASGDLREARDELRLAQGQDPGNREVRDLLAVVDREMQLKGER